jgi:endonuclease/exonuclease/phosphatase family metal-dependent hydrolase
MTRTFLLSTALALLATCAPSWTASAPEPHPLRVLVYNMHAGKDASGADNLPRVAEVVRKTEADLVLLQEVDRLTERSGRVDQIAELARLIGMHAAFGKTLDYQGGEYGIALFSRWPIAEDTLIHLPVDPPQLRAGGSREPRGVLLGRIAAPGGPLYALNTHLDPSREDSYRRQEAAALLEVAGRLRATGASVLLGGDLNATPESAVIGMLRGAGWRDAWEVCGRGEGLTYPAREPVKRIDYLFLPPGAECESAEVVGGKVSDHRGVVFVVRVGR